MARIGLTTNRKFLRLALALKSKALARGLLELLWEPCYESGDPYVGTADDIEAYLEWKGERGALAGALLAAGGGKSAGFIEPYAGALRDATATHYQIHDFAPSPPTRRRALTRMDPAHVCAQCGSPSLSQGLYCQPRCRQAAYRARHPVTSRYVTLRNADSLKGVRTYVPSVVPEVPVPQGTFPPGTDPQLSTGTVDSEAALRVTPRYVTDRNAVTDADDPPPDPVVLTFPVVGTGSKEWALTERQVAAWNAAFPSCDCLSECRKALAWVSASPSRRKTPRGMERFLVAWLARTTDSSRPTLISGSIKTAGNAESLRRFVERGDRE